MNTPARMGTVGNASLTADNICETVVIYEDVVAYGRAMEMAARLAMQFEGEPSFTFNSWNFRQLSDPTQALQAAEAAARADIVLLSAHGNDLPAAVGDWLDRCAGLRGKPEGALALLLAEPFMLSASSGSTLARLERAATRLKMDFLPLMPAPAVQIIKSFQNRPTVVPSGLMDALDRPRVEHWGLNE